MDNKIKMSETISEVTTKHIVEQKEDSPTKSVVVNDEENSENVAEKQ